MTNQKIKCYCNLCKKRRELGIEPAHIIVVEEDIEIKATRKWLPRFFRRKKRSK